MNDMPKSHRRDFVFAGILILAALGMLFVMKIFSTDPGGQIRITVDGKVWGTYSLSKDQTINIAEADCPDGYCKNQGKITTKNQTIVCLPHKLVVEVIENKDGKEDSGQEDAPDAVVK